MSAPLVELEAIRIERDGRLEGAEAASAAVREALAEGKLVILRGLLSAGWAREIRERAFAAMEQEPAWETPPSGAFGTAPNLTRLEVVPAKEGASARAFRTRLYFPWNECPAGEVPAALALARLRNVLAERDRALGAEDPGTFTVSQVVHYPRGGGFLARHFDHDDGLYCVIIVALSAPGRDFERGGLFVEPGGERVDVDRLLQPGDACLFRPDLYHGVDPIDPSGSGDGATNFADPGGRWVLNPMFRSVPVGDEEAARKQGPSPASERRAPATPAPAQPLAAPERLDFSLASSAAAPTFAVAPPAAERSLFQEWCRLLGIRAPGQRLGNVEVVGVDEEGVSFRVPGSPEPLRVACRAPGSGPVYRSTRRFGVYYVADDRQALSPVEDRFLHLLCELTLRKDSASSPAGSSQ